MTDRIDSDSWPSPRGPWPEVHDPTRVHDHGRYWCANAAGHPGPDGYPDPDRHVPWHECRSPEAWLHGARRDLDGEPVEVCVYLASRFRFGYPREGAQPAPTRVVLDVEASPGLDDVRVSLDLGEAVRLARILNLLVDQISVVRPSACPGRASSG